MTEEERYAAAWQDFRRRGFVVLIAVLAFSPLLAGCANPYGGLIRDRKGNLYGAASAGGANNAGVVFELWEIGVVGDWGQSRNSAHRSLICLAFIMGFGLGYIAARRQT